MQNSCFYCGEFATDNDHIVPRCVTTSTVPTTIEGYQQLSNIRHITVRACAECNQVILRDCMFTTLKDRIGFVREALTKQFKKLSNVEWDKSELMQLSYTLRTAVEPFQKRKEELKRRLEWDATLHGQAILLLELDMLAGCVEVSTTDLFHLDDHQQIATTFTCLQCKRKLRKTKRTQELCYLCRGRNKVKSNRLYCNRCHVGTIMPMSKTKLCDKCKRLERTECYKKSKQMVHAHEPIK